MNSELLIFVRKPELGKVKTRLAKTLGNQAALDIYIELLNYTRAIVQSLVVSKCIYYASQIDLNDNWSNDDFRKKSQVEGDLGYKMKTAFLESFSKNNQKVVLIGSDCFQLTTPVLVDAFNALTDFDLVLGPAADGGYYLIGMTKLHPELFSDIPWSTPEVLNLTLAAAKKLKLNVKLLPELTDIDEEADLVKSGFHYVKN